LTAYIAVNAGRARDLPRLPALTRVNAARAADPAARAALTLHINVNAARRADFRTRAALTRAAAEARARPGPLPLYEGGLVVK
jgi:hypothetical protein